MTSTAWIAAAATWRAKGDEGEALHCDEQARIAARHERHKAGQTPRTEDQRRADERAAQERDRDARRDER